MVKLTDNEKQILDDIKKNNKRFKFQQENPKKVGAYDRYENYKSATNYDQFIQLGGKNEDLRNDLQKGYIIIDNIDDILSDSNSEQSLITEIVDVEESVTEEEKNDEFSEEDNEENNGNVEEDHNTESILNSKKFVIFSYDINKIKLYEGEYFINYQYYYGDYSWLCIVDKITILNINKKINKDLFSKTYMKNTNNIIRLTKKRDVNISKEFGYNSINFNNDFDIYTKYKELNIIDYLKTIDIINEKYITLYNINNGDNQEKRMLNNIKYDNINDIIDNTNIENIKSNDKLISIQGDCIKMLDNLKQKTIQTIIIDPPYNIGKDTWDNIDNYNEWLTDIIKKLEYKLRDNGSMFIFHNNMEAISELMVSIKKNTKLKFVQMITWNKRYEGSKRKGFLDGYVSKNSAHKWELMAEYILFYIFDNTWKYKEARINKKVCAKDIQKEIPSKTGGMTGWYGNIETGLNHPTRERMIPITKHLGLEYDDVVPKFINQKTNHCVWNYDSAKKDKDSGHITPKPIELLENIIKHTTDENDILLDCFAGTGSLGKSCLNLNRKCVLIEKDDSYNNYINKKLF